MGYYLYKFLNNKDEIIYIGKTKNIYTRLNLQHFTTNGHLGESCYREVRTIFVSELSNAEELSIYERYLINLNKPKYNKQYNKNATFTFALPELNWLKYESNQQVAPFKTKGRHRVNSVMEIKEILKHEKLNFIKTIINNKKELIQKVSHQKQFTVEDLVELIKYNLLMSDRIYTRGTTYETIEKELYNEIKLSELNIKGFTIPEELLESNNLKQLKNGFSLRKASPKEFYIMLIKLSRKLNTKRVHRDWIKEFSKSCNLDCVLHSQQQNEYLISKGIKLTNTWFVLD